MEVRELYPNKTVQASDNRYFILNTLFNLPGTQIYLGVKYASPL
jgi:hypothetical protein